MRLSSKSDYGLRALIDLAIHAGGAPVQSHDIAARQGIPESYLNQLLIQLRRAGLVRSTRGPQGGHTLARLPAALTLADVIAALDGPTVADPASGPDGRGPGSDTTTDAVIHIAWERVDAAIAAALTRITLDDLLNDRQQREAAYLFEI